MSPRRAAPPRRAVSDRDYARLLAVRTGLREFERWSAETAATHGLTASQHQLLLAVRGDGTPDGPTVGQVADYLLVKHHSAVGLVDRCERAGLVVRVRDEHDHRVVRLRLSAQGERILAELSGAHLEELTRLGALFQALRGELDAR